MFEDMDGHLGGYVWGFLSVLLLGGDVRFPNGQCV